MAQSGYAILDLKEYGFKSFGITEKDLDEPVKFYKKVEDLCKLGKPLIITNLVDDENGYILKSVHASIDDETMGNYEINVNDGTIVYVISLTFDNVYVVKYRTKILNVNE